LFPSFAGRFGNGIRGALLRRILLRLLLPRNRRNPSQTYHW
jgi:hypothetical protein